NQGVTASVTNPVVVNALTTPPTTTQTAAVPLQARLLSTPPTSADGKIHIQGNSADIMFDFSTSSGNVTKSTFDKNIFYDSDGDNIPYNDADVTFYKLGTWKTSF